MCNSMGRAAPDTDVLLRQYAQTRDEYLREEIVRRHLKVAAIIAARFSGRGVEYDDLYQVASLALFKAVERYDPDRGIKFSTYITPTMVGEVKNYFRDRSRLIKLPRNSAELIRSMEKAIDEFVQQRQAQPTPEELAEHMDVELEDVLEALEMRGAARPASLDFTPETEDSDTPMSAFLGFEESGYSDFEMRDALRRAMELLEGQQQTIITLRYFEGLSQREVAKRLGISQMTVSRAERKALALMRGAMEDAEE